MEDWIKEAFEGANNDAGLIAEAEDVMNEFMDEHSIELVDGWCKVENKVNVEALRNAMKDKDVCLAVRALCAQFFINGFHIGRTWDRDLS